MKKYHKYIALAALTSSKLLPFGNRNKFHCAHLLAVLTCSLAACEQEDFTPSVQGDADAVKITATIGKLQTRVSYDERNTTFDENDQIKVVNKLRTSKNVATYTLTDEEWNTADPFVWNGASKNEFEAWYPLTASYTTFTIPTDQSSEQLLGAADWMTASSGEIDKPEDQTLNLDFQHQLSKVTVTIADWNDEFGGAAQEVSTPKIYSKGTDIEVVYATDGPNVTTSDGALTAITPSAVGHTYTAIVAPAKYATTDKFMTFTVNGQEMTVLATSSRLTNEGLQAGLHYLFDLKVGKDAVTLYSVKVTPWEEKEIDGGVATEALSSINATAMTPDKLNAAVTKALEEGETDITVTLKPDAPAEMITAIRRAICDTDGVADSSIHLTLKGVTTIPGTTNWDGVAFGPGDIYDEAGKIVDQELVTQLASINLPDVTEIGAQAFYFCENLVTVSAPKAQTIGAQALGYTALTSVEFPELTTIPTDMFSGTWTLSSAKFPKVTTIEQGGLLVGAKFWPENNPTPFPLELTAEGDITFNGSYHFNIAERNYTGKVDLVLNIDKKDQVTFHDDGTATWQVRDDLSYTFKSITFVGD